MGFQHIFLEGQIISSVQFSHSVMSDSVTAWTAACQISLSITNSLRFLKLIPLSQRCHPSISSSVVHFSSHLQSFPASETFLMSQLFALGGQIIEDSASPSVLPMNIQDWFPLGLTGLTSLQSKGFSSIFSNNTVQKCQFFNAQSSMVQLSHPYMTTEKTIALTRQTFAGKVMSLLFNMLSKLIIAFLPRSKCLLISWL